eukprot:Gb_11249 [translate_table: standard]
MVLENPSMDVVYIPLPTNLHLEWALKSSHKKKHILLDKLPALSMEELDQIIESFHSNGVQLMDDTMSMHHLGTPIMKDFLWNSELFGQLKMSNIRVRENLDALGALGDVGWYCICAILWANDYEMPQSVIVFPGVIFNEVKVVMACRCNFFWKDGRVDTYHINISLIMDFSIHGIKGTLHLHDFLIPYEENSASFTFSSGVKFVGIQTSWEPNPSEHLVTTKLPQEALMVQEFTSLVRDIFVNGGNPNP